MSIKNEISTFPHLLVAQQVSNYLAKTLHLGYPYISGGMFNYGSTVYRNKKPSDTDVIAICQGKFDYQEQFSINNMNDNTNIEVTLYSEKSFLEALYKHDISILECLFADKKHQLVPWSVYMERQIKQFEIDLPTLRASISKTASNSYVKAKKKLIVEADLDIECSLKSLWHSLRILDFGTQIAKNGTIDNFANANWLFPEILQDYTDTDCNWEEIHEIWKPMYNDKASEFKAVCPKE